MSSYQFFASDKPIKEVANPFIKLLSINDMIANDMEIPAMLNNVKDRNEKIILHCDSEDCLGEIQVMNEKNIPEGYLTRYTHKKYVSSLAWRYTDQRAEELVRYITEQLQHMNEIELWDTWMDEKVEEIIICECRIQDLSVQLIQETLGKGCYGKPSCLMIRAGTS